MVSYSYLFNPPLLKKLLEHQVQQCPSFELSLDLGRSTTKLSFNEDFSTLLLPDKHSLKMQSIKKIKDNTIYYVNEHSELKPLHFFCEETNKIYKLIPSKDYPSFTISSAPMHQITFSSPKEDTEAKVKLLEPISPEAFCLDCCFGLGYSAYETAKHTKAVISYEVDANVMRLAKINPYSKDVFTSDKIDIRMGDIFEEIKTFPDKYFDIIVHDPPTFKIAPMLYSSAFYLELKRVLKKSAKLFHYCPRPNIKVKKRDFKKEISQRLEEAGLKVIRYSEAAQGLLLKIK